MLKHYILIDDEIREVEDPTLWAAWFLNPHNRILGLDQVGAVKVSTIFLGWGEESDPILFETKIFGGIYDDYTTRYHTRTEAEIGHQNWVLRVLQVN